MSDERTVIAQLLMLGPKFTSADVRGIVSFGYLHDLIGDGFVEIIRSFYEGERQTRLTYRVTQLGKDRLK